MYVSGACMNLRISPNVRLAKWFRTARLNVNEPRGKQDINWSVQFTKRSQEYYQQKYIRPSHDIPFHELNTAS